MRGVDDHDDQPDRHDPSIILVHGDANIVPLNAGRKRPDYTHRPKGAFVWLPVLAVLFAYEMFGAVTNIEHTLSRTVWWVLGPQYETRWWFTMPPLAALLLWCIPHFATEGRVGPVVLVVMLGVSLLAGAVGAYVTR